MRSPRPFEDDVSANARTAVRGLAAAGLLAAAVLATGACGKPKLSLGRPDVLLVVVDTLRNDEMPWMGADERVAPNLGRLAREGIVFPKVYAPSPWTKPSTATILTGLHPLRHGLNGHRERLDPSIETLAESFQSHGYATSAVVANPSLYDEGYRQGFDAFRQAGEIHKWIVHSTDRVAVLAREALQEAPRDRPLFLYVHFLDPHDLYVPPQQDRFLLPQGPVPTDQRILGGDMRHFEGDTPVWEPTSADFSPTPVPLAAPDLAYMRGLYRGEIHAADRELAGIVAAQEKLRGNAVLVVVTADHGEEFYEHGMPRHGWTLHEEALRVPLLLHGAGLALRSLDPARIARCEDIAPTLLDLAGVEPGDRDGVSLARPAPAGGVTVVGLTRYHVQKESYVIEGGWKLIIDERFGRHELYDLAADPSERMNLAAGQPERVVALLHRQQELRDGLIARKYHTGTLVGEESRRNEEALKSLGYIGGGN